MCMDGESFSSCKLLNDPIEMLKCEIEDLLKMNNKLKLSFEDMKTSNDFQNEQLKVSIEQREAADNIQNQLLEKMTNVNGGLSSRCNENSCGPCACYTDYQLSKKYYCNCEHLEPERDCLAFRNVGYKISGLYLVHLNSDKAVEVFCDQETDDGGWTVIQRRLNGRTNFYRDWTSYKEGFGNPYREFWLGNDNIYLLTWQAEYPEGSELRVDMEDWLHREHFAKYGAFSIDNEEQKYQLHVNSFSGSGDISDSLSYHNGKMFSTYDADNDENSGQCAKSFSGAWWYRSCHYSNLNGLYQWVGETQNADGVVWNSGKGPVIFLKFTEMKVRRKE